MEHQSDREYMWGCAMVDISIVMISCDILVNSRGNTLYQDYVSSSCIVLFAVCQFMRNCILYYSFTNFQYRMLVRFRTKRV